MAEHGDIQEINQEQQLKDQLEKICLDYQSLVDKSREMAPKGTNTKKTSDPNAENSIDDEDLEGKSLSISLLCIYFLRFFASIYLFIFLRLIFLRILKRLQMLLIIWIH